jgi:hypothetical protein
MDPVKAKPVQALKAAEAPKRTAQQSQATPSPDAVAAKKAAEQATRPTTTNTRGETLGRHVNVTA